MSRGCTRATLAASSLPRMTETKLRRAPVGFGTFEPSGAVAMPITLRATCRYPFLPQRVLVASAWFLPEPMALIGDGNPYTLRVRPGDFGAGSQIDVVDGHAAREFELTITPAMSGAAALLGLIAVPVAEEVASGELYDDGDDDEDDGDGSG